MFVARVLNAADLWRAILCPFASSNLFIVSRSFLMIGFLSFPMYNIMSPAKRESSTFSFPLCTPLIFFFCLIAPDSNTTSTMLKWSVDSGCPCFISDFSRFSPFRMMLSVGFFYVTFSMLMLVLSGHTITVSFTTWKLLYYEVLFINC